MNISVIIPTCGRQTLTRAIQSAKAQELPFKEIVVVDDSPSGFKPEAMELIDKIGRTTGREGVAAARMLGVELLAPGTQAVCYLDDDDELLPNHAMLLSKKLTGGSAKFAFSKARFVHACGLETTDPEPSNPGPKRYYDPAALLRQNIAPVCSYAHTMEALHAAGGWDPSVLCMEDWDFWGRMFSRTGPPAMVDEVTSIVHKGHGSNMTDSNKFVYAMACSWRDIVADRLSFFRSHPGASLSSLAAFNAPRVAVVMPVYNAERYLAQALDSILGQSFGDLEVIAVNDASTDASARILGEFAAKDKRVRPFDMPERSGVTRTLNHGLMLSRSKFVARMDADDVSHKERIGQQVSFLENNKDVGVVGTRFFSMDESLSTIKWANNVETSPEEVAEALTRYCCIGHPTVMMRRSVIEALGGYSESEEHQAVEDYELWLRASKKYKIANLPDFLLMYREHDGQVSRTNSQAQKRNFEKLRRNAQGART